MESKHDFMAGTIGNKNAVGNKGGGRKSAYQERASAEYLIRHFFNLSKKEFDALFKRVESKRNYSVFDMMIYKALMGDTKIINNLSNKLYPDKIETSTPNDNKEAEVLDAIKQLAESKGHNEALVQGKE